VDAATTPEELLRGLRERADEDFLDPALDRQAGRHQADVTELGIRVAVTRARYPNRPGGEDLYAVTVSRLGLRQQPDPGEGYHALTTLFGREAADQAVERPGGPLIRMFRVPAAAAAPVR
jgi:hypothetical protein